MIKKMIYKNTHPYPQKIQKNLFYTPLTTRFTTLHSEKSTKPCVMNSAFFPSNKGLFTSITEYSQSFMKLANDFNIKNNITTFESSNDMNSFTEGEDNKNTCLTTSKKNTQKDNSTMKKNGNLKRVKLFTNNNNYFKKTKHSQQIIKLNELNVDNNRWFNLLKKNDIEEEFNYQITNYNIVKTLIQKEFGRIKHDKHNTPLNDSQKEQRESTTIQLAQRSNSNTNIIKPELIQSPSNNSITTKNIVLPFFKTKSATIDYTTNLRSSNSGNGQNVAFGNVTKEKIKDVEGLTNNLYNDIYINLFNQISVFPNLLDRNYIVFSKLSIMNLCFLKPLFEILFKSNLSITKDKFIKICSLIFEHLTFEEKKKFIITNKMCNRTIESKEQSKLLI